MTGQGGAAAKRAHWGCAALVLCILVPLRVAFAAEDRPAVPAQINDPFKAPNPDSWTQTFEHSGREVFDQRFRIVSALGFVPGMTVADVGAGTGMFSLLFARVVGEAGRVYAVDISQAFIDKVLERAGEYHVSNIVGVLGTQRDTGLGPESVDLVFVCDTYHHFEYPSVMLASIRQALRPGGELVVIDYRRGPGTGSPWIKEHVRAGEELVSEEIEAAGFARVGEETFLQDNWFLRFRKLGPTKDSAEAPPSKKSISVEHP